MAALKDQRAFVRHAPTQESGLCYGQSDVPVTLTSTEAAAQIRQQWPSHLEPPREIFCSPWQRTHLVAQQLAQEWQASLSVDLRLSEFHFGIWEGKLYATLEKDPAFRSWLEEYESRAAPGGESLLTFRERVMSWLNECGATSPLLVVTHAGVIRMLRALLRDIPYRDVALEPVQPLILEWL